MTRTLAFVAGFAGGWAARSAIDSSRPALVQIAAFGLDVVGRVKRALAIEREQFEDLVAEARDLAGRRRAERAHERRESAPVDHAA